MVGLKNKPFLLKWSFLGHVNSSGSRSPVWVKQKDTYGHGCVNVWTFTYSSVFFFATYQRVMYVHIKFDDRKTSPNGKVHSKCSTKKHLENSNIHTFYTYIVRKPFLLDIISFFCSLFMSTFFFRMTFFSIKQPWDLRVRNWTSRPELKKFMAPTRKKIKIPSHMSFFFRVNFFGKHS